MVSPEERARLHGGPAPEGAAYRAVPLRHRGTSPEALEVKLTDLKRMVTECFCAFTARAARSAG